MALLLCKMISGQIMILKMKFKCGFSSGKCSFCYCNTQIYLFKISGWNIWDSLTSNTSFVDLTQFLYLPTGTLQIFNLWFPVLDHGWEGSSPYQDLEGTFCLPSGTFLSSSVLRSIGQPTVQNGKPRCLGKWVHSAGWQQLRPCWALLIFSEVWLSLAIQGTELKLGNR